jgi:hypothetical protein
MNLQDSEDLKEFNLSGVPGPDLVVQNLQKCRDRVI